MSSTTRNDRLRLASTLALSLLVTASLGGCSSSHAATPDAQAPDGDPEVADAGTSRGDAAVITSCLLGAGPALVAGAACDFTETCTVSSLCYMGRSGTEYWTCVAGRVVYSDATWPCTPDAGPPPSSWCAGYVAPPAATTIDCRVEADCASSGGTCWAPGDTSGFDGSGACPMECAADVDCGAGRICHPLNGGICHVCTAACTESGCRVWQACGSDRHCGPANCLTDGYPCPPGSSCGLTGTPADLHGCSIAPCASDADCGCGACVLGSCALGPGRCDLPRA